LPVLFGDTFIGRVDCKAHRKTGEFEIIHFHLENTKSDPELWAEPFIASVKSFAHFNNCISIDVTKTSPSELKHLLKALI
jgi:uncharacterized protein YcaQ